MAELTYSLLSSQLSSQPTRPRDKAAAHAAPAECIAERDDLLSVPGQILIAPDHAVTP